MGTTQHHALASLRKVNSKLHHCSADSISLIDMFLINKFNLYLAIGVRKTQNSIKKLISSIIGVNLFIDLFKHLNTLGNSYKSV